MEAEHFNVKLRETEYATKTTGANFERVPTIVSKCTYFEILAIIL